MQEINIKSYRRHLPHIHSNGEILFITFATFRKYDKTHEKLDKKEIEIVLENIKNGDKKFYTLIAVVVLEDHVHLLIYPNKGYEISRITKGIKGTTAREINNKRGKVNTSVWQDESHDRIVRDKDELKNKLYYMLGNPVKKGYVGDPFKYEGWYYNERYEEEIKR